jgi:hypothetical protein
MFVDQARRARVPVALGEFSRTSCGKSVLRSHTTKQTAQVRFNPSQQWTVFLLLHGLLTTATLTLKVSRTCRLRRGHGSVRPLR